MGLDRFACRLRQTPEITTTTLPLRLLKPAAKQLADLRDYNADMPILPIVQPMPVVRQPQVQAQLVEVRIRRAEMLVARAAVLADRIKKRLLKIQRSVDQALRHGATIDLRERFRFRQ